MSVLKGWDVSVDPISYGENHSVIPSWYFEVASRQETVDLSRWTMNLRDSDALKSLRNVFELHLGYPGTNCRVVPKSMGCLWKLRKLYVTDEMAQATDAAGFKLVRDLHNLVRNLDELIDWLNRQSDAYNAEEELADWQRNYRHCEDLSKIFELKIFMRKYGVSSVFYRFPFLKSLDIDAPSASKGISKLSSLENLELALRPAYYGKTILPDDLDQCAALKTLTVTSYLDDFAPLRNLKHVRVEIKGIGEVSPLDISLAHRRNKSKELTLQDLKQFLNPKEGLVDYLKSWIPSIQIKIHW